MNPKTLNNVSLSGTDIFEGSDAGILSAALEPRDREQQPAPPSAQTALGDPRTLYPSLPPFFPFLPLSFTLYKPFGIMWLRTD